VPTIFIGGNHEASNVLQSYYYGGWVAPNIYFLGFAGVVWFGGVRISGTSGIFNSKHFHRGHYELPPYNSDTLRSVYHQRELEMWRLAMVTKKPDIFLSHDWPTGIWDYGDRDQLLKTKPFFHDDIKTNSMGSPPLMDLLKLLQPRFWFSAHLHVKFPAVVVHPSEDPSEVHTTRFLALDKVLPGR
jgi:lariat debranching enzyme